MAVPRVDCIPSEEVVRIPLRTRNGTVRAYAIVDAADAEWVNQWRWHLTSGGYAARSVQECKKRRKVWLHRAILGLTQGDGLEGDHINRDRLDSRRVNLRAVPKVGNSQNQPSYPGTSSHRGVYWQPARGTWRATVVVGGKRMHLGVFNTEGEAAVAARAGRLRLMPWAVD